MNQTIISTDTTWMLFGKPKRIVEIAVENPWYIKELFRKFKDWVLDDAARDYIVSNTPSNNKTANLLDVLRTNHDRCNKPDYYSSSEQLSRPIYQVSLKHPTLHRYLYGGYQTLF